LGVVEALDIIKEHPVSLSTVLGDIVLEALGFKGRKKVEWPRFGGQVLS
jgi:hypothetical protein